MSCRICFTQQETQENPLLSPCDCKGSMQYVHQDCLRMWLQSTTNPQFLTNCHVCLAPYNFPRKWPEEPLLQLNLGASLGYILGLISYFAHAQYMLSLNANLVHVYFDYKSYESNLIYFAIMNLLCIVYYVSYSSLISNIQSPRIYVNYLFKPVISDYSSNNYICPLLYMFLFIGSYVGTCVSIFPCGLLFIVMLSRYYTVHVAVCQAMNRDGQIPL
jgi:hypothetical protein